MKVQGRINFHTKKALQLRPLDRISVDVARCHQLHQGFELVREARDRERDWVHLYDSLCDFAGGSGCGEFGQDC